MIRFLSVLVFIIYFTNTGGTQTGPDSIKVIRILSFNIMHGETMKGDFDLDAIAQVIEDANPDFVALQEVDFKTYRARQMDLVTELGWRTKMAAIFGKAMAFDGGEYGEGILTKYSILQSRNVPLPCSPGNEPRAALEILTALPSGDTIAMIGTHLDHLEEETDRIMQARKINDVFSRNQYPTILAGDLNAVPGSRPIEILKGMWTSSYGNSDPKPTYSSDHPVKKIDYVFYYPENKWKVLATEAICDPVASDHCAYLVMLELLD